MNTSISISNNELTRKENFLVNTFVFFTFWSFFTGFPIAFNGFFRTILGGRFGMLLMFVQFIIYVYALLNTPRSFFVGNRKYVFAFAGALFFIWLWQLISIAEMDSSMITPLFSVPFFILLRDDLKMVCLDRFIRAFAIILFFSLLEFFIYLIFHKGILLFSGLGRMGFEDSVFYDFYDQYLLNIFFTARDVPRFQCLCEEPGCIGTLCGFLLYVTKGRSEYKFQYYVFIVAGVFAFSLAFFALFALHFFLNFKASSSTLFVLLALYILVFSAFVGLFQNMFLYRLEGGFMEADNRVGDVFGDVYSNAWKNGELWLPHGTEGGTFGAGAKMWIWMHGIISLIVLFLAYLFIYWRKAKVLKASRWECVIFFVAFWLSFYQRHWITNLDYMFIYVTMPIVYSYQDGKQKLLKKIRK